MTAAKTREHDNAKRDLRNFASMIARGSNWNGSLERGYASAFAAVLAVEDAHGVDAAAKVDDRLRVLAERSGLGRVARADIERQIVNGVPVHAITL